MRRGIKAILEKIYPTFDTASNELISKPCFILRFDTPIESATLGRYTAFAVICVAEPEDPISLDEMMEAAIKALNGVAVARVSDGTVFVPEYNGYTGDFPDDTLKALTKEVRFKVPVFGKDVM